MTTKITLVLVTIAMAFLPKPILAQKSVRSATFAADSAAIHQLAEKFKACIIEKDTNTFKTLFYDQNIKWVSVGDAKTIETLKKYDPNASPIRLAGAYDLFRDSRMASIALKEEFYNPILETDGILASYTFDYCFKINGAIQNWGKEHWQLVKVNNEWKIIALLYSFNLVFISPAPAYMK